MRHIREIKDLPISQLTDEEIVKAACKRLEAECLGMMFLDKDGQSYFITHWKNQNGRNFISRMMNAWADKFGKMKTLYIND